MRTYSYFKEIKRPDKMLISPPARGMREAGFEIGNRLYGCLNPTTRELIFRNDQTYPEGFVPLQQYTISRNGYTDNALMSIPISYLRMFNVGDVLRISLAPDEKAITITPAMEELYKLPEV